MVIAILGLGTVGSGVNELAARTPNLKVKKILEKRFTGPQITDNMEDIVSDEEITLVCETMGGLHPAYEFAVRVLEAKKHFVTANKLLVAEKGAELRALAEKNNVAFLYSAACGGGIPYLQALRLAHETDEVTALGGILNGTTNLILDAMQTDGQSYDEALAEAQRLGYAEKDPSSDVDGLDTMRKLILACAVGFDAEITSADIPTAGIRNTTVADIAYAKKTNRVLRLCAFAEKNGDALSAYVEPTLLPASAQEASIIKNLNYAWYEGYGAGHMGFSGQGAGKLPTASNIIRDVACVAAGQRSMTQPSLAPHAIDNTAARHPYYVRIPKEAAFRTEWIDKTIAADGETLIETVPLSPAEMHTAMKAIPGAFFAGIRKG